MPSSSHHGPTFERAGIKHSCCFLATFWALHIFSPGNSVETKCSRLALNQEADQVYLFEKVIFHISLLIDMKFKHLSNKKGVVCCRISVRTMAKISGFVLFIIFFSFPSLCGGAEPGYKEALEYFRVRKQSKQKPIIPKEELPGNRGSEKQIKARDHNVSRKTKRALERVRTKNSFFQFAPMGAVEDDEFSLGLRFGYLQRFSSRIFQGLNLSLLRDFEDEELYRAILSHQVIFELVEARLGALVSLGAGRSFGRETSALVSFQAGLNFVLHEYEGRRLVLEGSYGQEVYFKDGAGREGFYVVLGFNF